VSTVREPITVSMPPGVEHQEIVEIDPKEGEPDHRLDASGR